jgi:hypothetical protein
MAAFRNYKTLSDKEVALDPNNITWRMEVQNADANLGVMLFNGRSIPRRRLSWNKR